MKGAGVGVIQYPKRGSLDQPTNQAKGYRKCDQRRYGHYGKRRRKASHHDSGYSGLP
jgi:hypothetical protein